MTVFANRRVRLFLAPILAAILLLGWIAYSSGSARSPLPKVHAAAPTKRLTASDMLLAASAAKSGIFLQYDGVTGAPSTDHTNHAQLNSFQWGVGRGVSSPAGGNRQASTPSVSEITVTKSFDQYSVPFVREALSGDGTNNAVIYFTQLDKVTGTIVQYLEFDLSNVFISGYSTSAGSRGTPSESLSLNFTKITMKAHVSGVPDQVVSYDLATAKVS